MRNTLHRDLPPPIAGGGDHEGRRGSRGRGGEARGKAQEAFRRLDEGREAASGGGARQAAAGKLLSERVGNPRANVRGRSVSPGSRTARYFSFVHPFLEPMRAFVTAHSSSSGQPVPVVRQGRVGSAPGIQVVGFRGHCHAGAS